MGRSDRIGEKNRMKKEIIIGILGGMGPRSTPHFLNLVLDECQKQYAAKYDQDFPPMIVYSLPTPFFIDRQIDHKEMEKTVCHGLNKLSSTKVSFIVVPCNSAHLYFKKMEQSVDIPLLNIVDETVKRISTREKITLFATSFTFDSQLYQGKLRQSGFEIIWKNTWQRKINQILSLVKANQHKEAQKLWDILLGSVEKEEIRTIIIACTDLSTLKVKSKTLKIVDSSLCLAQATVKEYIKRKGKL